MNTLRVAIYTRISKKDSTQDTENQAIELRTFCGRMGWHIVAEFTDRATGKNSDRDQFKMMFAAAARHEFDTLVFWALDRLTREGALATLKHLERLSALGVGFHSYREEFLNSCGPLKDGIIALLAALARQERLRISERVNAGLARAKAQGRVGGRRKVTHDAKPLLALREAGHSLAQIGAELNMTKSMVARVLRGAQCAQVTQ